MTPAMTTRARLATVATLTLAATLLTGCADDPPTPDASASPRISGSASGTGSTSTSPSPSPSPSLQDRSSQVVDGVQTLEPIATTTARPDSTFAGSTFTIYRLTRTDTSTLLVWRVTGGDTHSSPRDAGVRSWEKYPVMVTAGKRYFVVTFDKQGDGWSALSDRIVRIDKGEQTPPQAALYPPLPPGTTQVTLASAWFHDVTVPVTDVG